MPANYFPGPGPQPGPPGPPGPSGPPAPSSNAGQVSIADPVGTSSNSWVMMGLGVQITPMASRAIVLCSGQIMNSTNNGETDAQLMYGVGTSPSHGDPIPVDAVLLSSPIRFKATSGGGAFVPFSQSALIEYLDPGVEIWVGLALKVTSGNGSVQDLDVIAFELS